MYIGMTNSSTYVMCCHELSIIQYQSVSVLETFDR